MRISFASTTLIPLSLIVCSLSVLFLSASFIHDLPEKVHQCHLKILFIQDEIFCAKNNSNSINNVQKSFICLYIWCSRVNISIPYWCQETVQFLLMLIVWLPKEYLMWYVNVDLFYFCIFLFLFWYRIHGHFMIQFALLVIIYIFADSRWFHTWS